MTRLPLGVYAYVGMPQHGKTTCAIAEQGELARSHGLVPLTIDTLGADNFTQYRHASSAKAACELAFGQGRPTYYTPSGKADFEAILRAVKAAKNCALLVDEISHWPWSTALSDLARGWKHARSALLVTSQHVTGDLGARFLSCAPHLRIFRTDAPVTLEFWMRWKGLDADRIRRLAVGEHVDLDL